MAKADKREGLLARLAKGVVVGDGGFCFAMEKRGYVKVGVWTPECTVRHPEAGGFVDHEVFYKSKKFPHVDIFWFFASYG